jgi:hypothetical protein
MIMCARRAGAARRTGRCTRCRRCGWAARCWRRCATATGSTPATVDDIIFGCVDPVGEAGAVIPRSAAFEAGYATKAPGMQISRFCASGLDAINLGAAKIAQGCGRHRHRRRRRIDEPRRHGHVGRRLVHGPLGRPARLVHAAGRLGRPDRHEIRLFARRRRRLRGREPEARGAGLGKGLRFKKSVIPVRTRTA